MIIINEINEKKYNYLCYYTGNYFNENNNSVDILLL